jgi:hypothetical protein
MPPTPLLPQNRQQIGDDIQPLRQQLHPLPNLEITPHRSIHGLEMRLRPHQLGTIEHRALQMNINSQNEQLPDLHIQLPPTEIDRPRLRDQGRQRRRILDGGGDEVLKQAGLDRLGERVADGQLDHVVLGLAQADEVVVDARLVVARVVEVEVLRLRRLGRQRCRGELAHVGQQSPLLRGRHPPHHDCAVVEDEDLGRRDRAGEVGVVARVELVAGALVKVRGGLGGQGAVARIVHDGGVLLRFICHVNEIFPSVLGIVFHLHSGIGIPPFSSPRWWG